MANFNGIRVKNHPKPWTCPLNRSIRGRGKTPIKIEAKFLGVIFDTKLTFKNHNQYLKTCQKALDILRVVGHTDWGADRIILLRLYHSLVCSKFDYGCILYGSAHVSIQKKNWIQSTIRAFKSRWVISAHLLLKVYT